MLKHEAPGAALVLQPLSWGLARFASSLWALSLPFKSWQGFMEASDDAKICEESSAPAQ